VALAVALRFSPKCGGSYPKNLRRWVQGSFERWRFALGCASVALFPPATTGWWRYWMDAFKRLGPVCGVLSVALPPLSLPLLHFISIACNAFRTHDNFSSGELMPTLLGACILGSLACMFSGVPLGLAGLIRRERFRWLSVTGPLSSILIFGYMQIVQHLAMQRGDRGFIRAWPYRPSLSASPGIARSMRCQPSRTACFA
jgi:hypothetical protein